MKVYSLTFIDEAQEAKFQEKEHMDRVGLLRLYLFIKICLGLIEIIFHWSLHDPISAFRQGFIVLGSFSGFFIILLQKSVKASMMVNFVQVVMPILTIFTNASFTLVLSPPKDNLFMYGGFKAINIASLYFLGTNYISNSICFIFATSLSAYLYIPPLPTFNATNYFAASIWLIALKYINDKDRRTQYLLKMKDEYWTHVMKDMINDWVIVLTHDKQKDQITVRDANQNFQRSCQIFDDKAFRTFVRTIRIQDSNNQDHSLNTIFSQQNQTPYQKKKIYKESDVQKLPNLEQVLRDNLILQENHHLIVEQPQQNRRKSFSWSKLDHVKVKKFIGVKMEITKNNYTVYSIRLIKGSDKESFLLLIIKQLKIQSITAQQPKCLVMKNNLIRMSNICAQYLKITEQIYNNAQEGGKTIRISQSSIKHMKSSVTSQIISVTNSHFTHQLYLNQMHNISDFKFDSRISSINLYQMIEQLQKYKLNQIKIILEIQNHRNFIMESFQRELSHLFLIFIENIIKHNKSTQSVVKIEISEEEFGILIIRFQDYGKGIPKNSIKQLLDSYKIDISKQQKVQILNHSDFNLHIRQEMKYGWVAARLLLSLLSPISSFKTHSIEGEGSTFTFQLYKDMTDIVKLRKIS